MDPTVRVMSKRESAAEVAKDRVMPETERAADELIVRDDVETTDMDAVDPIVRVLATRIAAVDPTVRVIPRTDMEAVAAIVLVLVVWIAAVAVTVRVSVSPKLSVG